MPECLFKWNSPYILPPGTNRIQVGRMTVSVKGDMIHIQQECCLVRGHDGPHISKTSVTHPGPPPRPKVDKPPATEMRGF